MTATRKQKSLAGRGRRLSYVLFFLLMPYHATFSFSVNEPMQGASNKSVITIPFLNVVCLKPICGKGLCNN